MNPPLIVSYGAGVNSTAVLVGCVERRIVPYAILFADTGAEKPDTYAYLDTIDAYLQAHNMPTITRLRYRPSRGRGERIWESLEEECLERAQLPSLAYGWHKCSEKWKVRPQMRWLAAEDRLQDFIAGGGLVHKAIGFRLGEERRKKEHIQDPGTVKVFPLLDWRWEQEDCIAAIQRAGLPVPPKSSCFFCPASTAVDVADLGRRYPELAARAVAIEDGARAAGNLQTVEGLGRHWTWRAVLEYEQRKQWLFAPEDDAQLCRTFRDPMESPCGCYDGGDDD